VRKPCRKQWNVDVFTTYSQRHEDLIHGFPDYAFFDRFDPAKLPPRSAELTIATRKYLNLICDVHYLFCQGYLDNSIWQIWQADLRRTLNSPLIVREWADLKSEFQSFTAFLEFVEISDRQKPNRSLQINCRLILSCDNFSICIEDD
jgi:hypothetical protein